MKTSVLSAAKSIKIIDSSINLTFKLSLHLTQLIQPIHQWIMDGADDTTTIRMWKSKNFVRLYEIDFKLPIFSSLFYLESNSMNYWLNSYYQKDMWNCGGNWIFLRETERHKRYKSSIIGNRIKLIHSIKTEMKMTDDDWHSFVPARDRFSRHS